MRALSKAATKILELLAAGLNPHDSRVVGKASDGYMPVTVERLGDIGEGPQVSVAHYYRQNGDAMRDPEIVFWRGADGSWYPIQWTQDNLPVPFQQLVTFNDLGVPTKYLPRAQKDVAVFVNGTWFPNVKAQQAEWFAGRGYSVVRRDGGARIQERGGEPAPEPTVTEQPVVEAAMTDAEVWGPEAEAIWNLMIEPVKTHPLLPLVKPLVVPRIIAKLARGEKPRRGYFVGPVGGAVEVEAVVEAPRVPTPRQPTPRQPTPAQVAPASSSPAQGAQQVYTRAQAEAAVLSAWEAFQAARPDLFTA